MPLPSQSSRGGPSHASRMVSSRKAGGRGRRVGGVVLALAVVVGLWWVIFGRGSDGKLQDANAGTKSGETKLASADNKPTRPEGTGDSVRMGDRDTPKPFHRAGSDNTWSDQPEKPVEQVASLEPDPLTNAKKDETKPAQKPSDETKSLTPPVVVEKPATRVEEPPTRVTSPSVRALIEEGGRAAQENRLVEARRLLNRALHDPSATEGERAQLRDAIGRMNETLVFSATAVAGDPLAETYTIGSGDVLSKIVRTHRLGVEWQFIQRINKISDPARIRVGQNIKFVRGPFHAVVSKSAFRMDIYADINDGAGNRMFIRSFPVGLGEHGSTPTGSFVVNSSKMMNPSWVNPRTREKFGADDPKNPIGERWLGLTGTSAETEHLSGYGIHGTIDPESIGKEMSMGCIRCRAGDVEMIYEMLVPESSTVEIVP